MSTPYRSELCYAIDPLYANGMPIRPTNEREPQNNVVEEDHDSGDEISDSDVQLTEAQINHSCRAMVLCQWMDCGAGISCKSVPAHFRDTHCIKGKEESAKIYCQWKGCGRYITFKNFNRHIREPHLGHPRSKKDDS